jgi:hypothetical protein
MNICRGIMFILVLICHITHAHTEPFGPQPADEPATSSALASGKWFKIKIYNDGIYRLTYDDLTNMGFSNPAEIRLFGNGGKMLPLMNNMPRYDDLTENAVYMSKGTDGIFNAGDFILFYAKGPQSWNYNTGTGMFEYELHNFSAASYYFLTTTYGDGLKITVSPAVSGLPDESVNEYDYFDYHERNLRNFLKSGRQWFGERIDYEAYDTTFNFTGLEITSAVKVKFNVVSRSKNTKVFTLRNNGSVFGTISVPAVILENTTGIYANQKSGQFSFFATGNQINLSVAYNKTLSSDEGFLDYITINVRRKLSLYDNLLFFRDVTWTGAGKIAEYSIENCNANTEIWDVTDSHHIKQVPAQLFGNILKFSDSTSILKEYAAVNTAAVFPKPQISSVDNDAGIIANQNLHAADPVEMLIVTHPQFSEAADSIAAFHRQRDSLTVLVVSTDQIYNEFSSGAPDVSAIRDMAGMLYNRATGDDNRLKYLLLLGDGSYNNISNASGNSNYILTYQSENSLNAGSSYVSDDFFGLMEDGEGGSNSMEDFSLDLAVGRLPAKSPEEAMAMYRKIRHYNSSETMADWRNNILFAADDEDGNLHMTQANSLADWVGANYPRFNIKKVLIDAYRQESTSTGARYPEVNRIINDNFNKGLLIFNYTGHGGVRYLAAERILLDEDLETFTNFDNLPLLVTATCEFSRFDDLTDNDGELIENTSAGEYSLLNPAGGSIALFTTTRIVYSDQNHNLNSKFFEIVFERDAENHYRKLGEAIRIAKNQSGDNRNKLNFILLGDPALSLAIPEYTIVTDSLNGVAIADPLDSLKAFSSVHISGHIEDYNNNLQSTYNGLLYPSVYDKSRLASTLANDNGATMQFTVRENLIFKGKISVINGKFSFDFQVPKDIEYNYGTGKITYYSDNQTTDGNGYFSDFIIGGTNTGVTLDNKGPDLSLFLNDPNFNNQGITNTNPVIYALINDESGINTVGNGIGHDITGVVDDNVADPIVLNEYFEANLDDYTSGILQYPMKNLTPGWHSLKVKVWDIFNNSSEKTIAFHVLSGSETKMANVFNYPNPATIETFFVFEHNMPGEELKVAISIYNMEGRIIAVLNYSLITDGFNSGAISWNLHDQNGNPLRQGIYPYKIRITNTDGSYAESFQKLVIIRQ